MDTNSVAQFEATNNVSEESLNAAMIAQKLSGMSMDQLLSSSISVVDDNIVFEDEQPRKRSGRISRANDPLVKAREKYLKNQIKFEEKFNTLPSGNAISVDFMAHSIKYKDQDWPIPARKVIYRCSKCTQKNVAKKVASYFDDSSANLKRAEDGKDLYYIVITDIEAIPYFFRTLGYIKVSNSMKTMVKLAVTNEHKDLIDTQRLQKLLQNTANNLIKVDTDNE